MLRSHLPERASALRIYTAAVLANYAAQVPYNLHLYGGAFSRTGALVLGATLVWFLVAAALYRAGRRAGYWLLLSYAAVQVLFYLNNEVLLAFAGYGLPYHLVRTEDLLVWVVFIVGDLNFLAAVGMVAYMLIDRFAAPRADSSPSPKNCRQVGRRRCPDATGRSEARGCRRRAGSRL